MLAVIGEDLWLTHLHPEPWRTRGDYDEDRRRMKYMMLASVTASIGAVISPVAALIAVVYAIVKH